MAPEGDGTSITPLSNSIEYFNQYQNFQRDSANVFSFYEYEAFCEKHHLTHRLLCCVFIEVDFEKNIKF